MRMPSCLLLGKCPAAGRRVVPCFFWYWTADSSVAVLGFGLSGFVLGPGGTVGFCVGPFSAAQYALSAQCHAQCGIVRKLSDLRI
jgi:hypothetical protein